MKKVLFSLMAAFVWLSLSASACSPEPLPELKPEQIPEDQQPVSNIDELHFHTIVNLWKMKMRQHLLLPFNLYILQREDGKWFYLNRTNYGQELRVGDDVAASYYTNCPDELAVIHERRTHGGAPARVNATKPALGSYLVASDPIEADVKNLFFLNMRYTSLFSPIETCLIETTDGNLIYVKASKLAETNSQSLSVGDHFVYSVYTIYPNEVVAIKKL